MVFKKFIKIMGGTSRKLRMAERLIDKYEDIMYLFHKLQFHFTADERIPLVVKSLKATNKDDMFISLLRSI